MNSLFKAAFIFILLILIQSVLVNTAGMTWGQVDYFTNHGLFLLVGLTLFPRLTLLFSSIPFGGVFWWLGFFFCPRILVASLATIAYFKTNPFLVVASWMVALSGETWEKNRIQKSGFVFRSVRGQPEMPREKPSDSDVIEPEYKVIHKD